MSIHQCRVLLCSQVGNDGEISFGQTEIWCQLPVVVLNDTQLEVLEVMHNALGRRNVVRMQQNGHKTTLFNVCPFHTNLWLQVEAILDFVSNVSCWSQSRKNLHHDPVWPHAHYWTGCWCGDASQMRKILLTWQVLVPMCSHTGSFDIPRGST